MTESVMNKLNRNMITMKLALKEVEINDLEYILSRKEQFNDFLKDDNYLVSLSSKNEFTRKLAKILNLSFFIHQKNTLSKQWLISNKDCDCKRLIFVSLNGTNYLINCLKNKLGMDFAFVPSKNQTPTENFNLINALQQELNNLKA